jgi:hypothetical protein
MGVSVGEPADLVAPASVGEVLEGRERVLVLEEVDELAAVLVAHGAVEGERRLGVEVLHLVELVAGDPRLLLELFDGGLPPVRAMTACVARATRL